MKKCLGTKPAVGGFKGIRAVMASAVFAAAAFAASAVLAGCGGASAGGTDEVSDSLKSDLGIWSGEFESSDEGSVESSREGYVSYSTEFGLTYELPDYWIHSIESTDTESYNYRNSVLDEDGAMVIAYISYEDLGGEGLSDLTAMYADELAASYKDAVITCGEFETEHAAGEAIHAAGVEADYGTACIDMYLLDCGDGVAAVTFSRLEDSDYEEEFQEIMDSVSISAGS